MAKDQKRRMSESLRAPQRLAQLTTNELLLAAVVACQEEAGEYVLRPVLKNLSVSFEDKWFAKSHAARDTRLMRHNMLNASAGGIAATPAGLSLLKDKLGADYDICLAHIRGAARPSKRSPELPEAGAHAKRPRPRKDADAEQPSEEALPNQPSKSKAGAQKRRSEGTRAEQSPNEAEESSQTPKRTSEEAPTESGTPPERPREKQPREKQPREKQPREKQSREKQPREKQPEVAREDVGAELAQQSPRGGQEEPRDDVGSELTPRRSGGVFTDSFRNELADVWWLHIKQALRVDTIAKLESEHGVGSALRGPAAIRKVHVVLTVLEQYFSSMQIFHTFVDDFASAHGAEAFIAKFFPPGCGAPLHSSDLFFTPYDEGGSDAGIAEQIECIIFDASNPRLCLGSGKC